MWKEFYKNHSGDFYKSYVDKDLNLDDEKFINGILKETKLAINDEVKENTLELFILFRLVSNNLKMYIR